MFNPKVRNIDFELTNRCNASCPLCARSGVYKGELSEEMFNSGVFDVSTEVHKHVIDSLDHSAVDAIDYSGCYGDPLMHRDALQIFKQGEGLYQEVQTNASLQSQKFWKETAKIKNLRMWFHIDGLKDTNHLYRRFTVWEKIERNAKTFLDAGGSGSWCFIVWKHNEHQVEEARELATKWGMDEFIVKKTSRGFEDNNTITSRDILTKDGLETFTYEMPTIKEYQVQHFTDDLQELPIDCYSKKRGTFYINCQNNLYPCCITGQQHYKNQFMEKRTIDPIYGDIDFDFTIDPVNNKFQHIVDQYNELEQWFHMRWKNRHYKHCVKRCGTNLTSNKVHEPINGGEGSKRMEGWSGPHSIRNQWNA
tara:strand:- start:2504 stop:3595 length:1092 start_codon:yes stop_codon:yes gene_type:complete